MNFMDDLSNLYASIEAEGIFVVQVYMTDEVRSKLDRDGWITEDKLWGAKIYKHDIKKVIIFGKTFPDEKVLSKELVYE